ncbi:MFS transporter [Kineococcus aurantiacus]|uniref:GPH family glycoside/pentoside/hexuronide:cation symporter n=1 Tax=Kineococcus aurantiacus TaxID=37633 RepID=A0A7Y9AUE1_9ACTN|nr:glycoside-pentoside-hexuronide (GPH):cation symporter [Kineococcus aurantiacus]NYD21916.1 GPH family glycoside/pentoside/hexuronide:cation symporter [Kineococcus aurantiacus]
MTHLPVRSTVAPPAPAPAGPARLRRREKLAYGAGDLASNLSWNFVGSFLLFYYTDVAGVPIALLGTLFLVARLLDAVIDPFIGVLVDRTRTRFGRARPYLLFAAVPFGVLGVLTFAVPDVGDTGKLVYAFVTYLTLGILFSLVNVPYSALMPMMTRDREERMQLGALRSVGSSVGTIVVTAATTPLVAALGGGQHGWTVATVLYSALSIVFFACTFAGCRERHAVAAEPVALDARGDVRADLRASLRGLLRNRAWVVTSVYGVLNFVRLGLVLAVTVYYALVVLQRPSAISILLPLVSGAMLVGGLLAPRYYRRLGIRRGNLLALAVGGTGWAALSLVESRFGVFVAVYAVATLAIGLSMTSMFTMVAEAVEHQERVSGRRDEGLVSASVSFALKVGSALGAAAVAYALAGAGYDPAVPGSAAGTISALYLLAPVVLVAAQAVVVLLWSDVPSGAPSDVPSGVTVPTHPSRPHQSPEDVR